MDALTQLRQFLADGKFHHATYRSQGTLWEGLHVYIRSSAGWGGFEHALLIHKDDPALSEAMRLCAPTGISLGAYGEG